MMVLLIFGLCFGLLVWLCQHFPESMGGAPRIVKLRLTLAQAKELEHDLVAGSKSIGEGSPSGGISQHNTYVALRAAIKDAETNTFPRLLSWIFRPKLWKP